MLDSIFINISLFKRILIPLPIGQVMSIIARILEWAQSPSLVEMPAGNLGEGVTILVY